MSELLCWGPFGAQVGAAPVGMEGTVMVVRDGVVKEGKGEGQHVEQAAAAVV